MAGPLKVSAVQFGDSSTATQNFVLQQNADGTAKFARGNVGATTQDIFTIDAAGLVAMPQSVVAFSAYQNAPTSIGTAATLIPFQAKSFDTALAFSTTTGRFSPQVAAYYQVTWSVMGDGNTAVLWSSLRKNGSDVAFGSRAPAVGPFPLSTGSALIYLNGSTDYLDVAAYSSVASATHTPIYTTQFSGYLVAKA